MKKKIRIIFVLVFFTFGLLFLLPIFESKETKLKKIGYKDEITDILKLKDISYILSSDYIPNLSSYLKDEAFLESNLKKYIEDKNELEIKDKIRLVNHKNYKKDISYTKLMVDILYDKYYIKEREERYFKQKKQDARSIVEYVNANRDTLEYIDIKESKLDKYTMLANKYYTIKNYTPKLKDISFYGNNNVLIDEDIYKPFVSLYEDAKKNGHTLYVTSGYRSYKEQRDVYNEYKKTNNADKYAARPGYSEHQTGLALDIFIKGSTTKTFQNTKAALWLSENAHKYGFILRYPKGKEEITGYSYEAWHYRYVGVDIATYIYENNITFDEYYAYFIDTKEN